MIYIDIPIADYSGWGICGKNIVKEMSRITDIKVFSKLHAVFENVMDRPYFSRFFASDDEIVDVANGTISEVDCPILEKIPYNRPFTFEEIVTHNLKGSKKVGYTFFEENDLTPEIINNFRTYWDVVVTGASWIEELLRAYGLTNVKTIIQGIDPSIFNPYYSEKEYYHDNFVVFSGGKYEIRKSQDIVMQAYKVLQDKYKDVMLVNSWLNDPELINQFMSSIGLDMDRVISLPPYPNIMQAKIYKNSDIGLFPNRCEGGTNLVLMEYMACGKPVIASYNSGHKDILTADNSIRIMNMSKMQLTIDTGATVEWDNPNLDEVVSHLEWAYHNRDKLRLIGEQAGKDLAKNTWKRTTERFLEVLTS